MLLKEALEAELKFRRSRSSRYSLRAFARDLDLSPSFLSRFLSGRRVPSTATCESLVHHLARFEGMAPIVTVQLPDQPRPMSFLPLGGGAPARFNLNDLLILQTLLLAGGPISERDLSVALKVEEELLRKELFDLEGRSLVERDLAGLWFVRFEKILIDSRAGDVMDQLVKQEGQSPCSGRERSMRFVGAIGVTSACIKNFQKQALAFGGALESKLTQKDGHKEAYLVMVSLVPLKKR